MKKIVFPGIVAAIASLAAMMAVGFLFQFIDPSLKASYCNPEIFRPWSDPIMNIFWFQPFLLAIAIAWIWDKTKQLFTGSLLKNTWNFSVITLIVSIIPGMLMSYSSFKISIIMTMSWTISGFAQIFVAVLVIGKMNK